MIPLMNKQVARKTKLKTRILVWREGDGFLWRAPIVEGNSAQAELRATRDYETFISALEAGKRHVRRLFPGIVLE